MKKRSYKKWNDREKEILREKYLNLSNVELAILLNRTQKSIISKLTTLGLKRPKEWKSKKMKKENPMFNKEIKKKRKDTIKQKYPNWGNFNIGVKRPHLTKRNLEDNPMKNPESKKKMVLKKKGKSYEEQYGKEIALKKKEKHSQIMKQKWSDENFRNNRRKIILKSLCKRPTKPEKIMMEIIKQNNLPFNYVGDGEIIIGGFNPDFLSKNPKHIIEINGDYWHNLSHIKEKDKRKLETYAKYGYKTLIIWESELKNPIQVIEKINKFIRR